MFITELSIKRPTVSWVMSLILIIFGLFVAKKLKGDDYEPDVAPMVLEKYGNVASAGSLIAFHETKDDFKSGEMGVICSFGAGYSICSLVVEKI